MSVWGAAGGWSGVGFFDGGCSGVGFVVAGCSGVNSTSMTTVGGAESASGGAGCPRAAAQTR